MVRRKGELSRNRVDAGWPFQVALAQRLTAAKKLDEVCAFCKDLSPCFRGPSFLRDDEFFNCWCFENDKTRVVSP